MIHILKNIPVRELIRALEKDGFQYKRRKESQRVYRHSDGRRVVIHYHHAKDTLPPGTLKSFLIAQATLTAQLAQIGQT